MRRPVSPPSAAEPVVTRIGVVGADGDGIGALPDGTTLYIPLTLPGELVRAQPAARRGAGWAATAEEIAEPSASRVLPPCRHFGTCGGCAMQHWRDEDYIAWKSDLLRAALQRAGFAEPTLSPVARTPPEARRRMDLAARRNAGTILLGLHRLRGSDVVDLTDCQVLHQKLWALLGPLRDLLRRLQGLHLEASVIANLLDSGCDLLLRTDAPLNRSDRTALIEFARAHALPRIAWAKGADEPEPICVLRPPTTSLAGVAVVPPPGGFLQASKQGAAAIIAAVLAGLPAKGRVAELYCGCGTLSFALVQHAQVVAWDSDANAIAALRQAANQAGLAGRLTATPRDLTRQPLSARELAPFAAVVLDPPFAGAAVQMPTIVAAKSPVVIYVSCNPAVLARDARVLCDAGYSLLSATPIDQFLWSAQLESVCVFQAPGSGHGKPKFSRSVAPL